MLGEEGHRLTVAVRRPEKLAGAAAELRERCYEVEEMADFIREQIPAEEMIEPADVAEAVRFLLRTSPACVVPEIVFQRPGESV